MPEYSHSRLSTFEQCKLKFRYQYIDHIETEIENTVEAFMGSLVHETLEKLYKDISFAKINSLQELITFFRKRWEEDWSDAILIVREQYSAENYREMGERFITDFYKRYQPFNEGKTVGLENREMVRIGPYILQGYIDRLSSFPNGVYEIHDYKTGNSLPTQKDVDNDRQLALYALAVKEKYKDCREVILVWHYLAFDRELRSTRTKEQFELLKKDLQMLIDVVEKTTSFPPKESALCSWCQFKPICPVWKHEFQAPQMSLDEFGKDEGVNLVKEYALLRTISFSKILLGNW